MFFYFFEKQEVIRKVEKEVMETSVVNSLKERFIVLENYRLTAKEQEPTSLRQKCINNIKALEVIRNLNLGRIASPKEQKILAKFTGWGSLAQKVFSDNPKDEWSLLSSKIKFLLSKQEIENAKASSLTAFFTPVNIIKFIYKVIGKFGFTGGRILEPSCGTGNFIGCIPNSIIAKITAIESDSITSKICQNLYPKVNVINSPFENVELKEDSFDLVLGNVPFGDFKVFDKKYNKYGFSIHNYFISKSLDTLRPGGILALITSRFTMDSKSVKARAYLAERGKLLAAVRLPNSVFKTAPVDILFLQKYTEGEKKCLTWLNTNKTKEGLELNQYFIDNPKMIIGSVQLSTTTNQYGNYDLVVNPPEDLDKSLNNIIKYMPKDIYTEISGVSSYLFNDDELLNATDYPDVQEFSFVVIENKLYQRQGEVLIPYLSNYNDEGRIRGLIKIKEKLFDLINFQVNNSTDEGLKSLQQQLNVEYDNFVRTYKHICSSENKRAFDQDPNYILLSSLEVIEDNKIKKSPIFTERTISYETQIKKVNTVEEGLIVSINRNLEIDIDYISSLVGNTPEDVTNELISKKLIFRDPQLNRFVLKEEYLSGKVVDKLNYMLSMPKEKSNKKIYMYNIAELKKVQPERIEYFDINVKLGSTWIPAKYIKQFITELFNIPNDVDEKNFSVYFSKVTALWEINVLCSDLMDKYVNETKFGTSRISALKILKKMINLNIINVYDRVFDANKKDYISVVNKKETILARQKGEELNRYFVEWLWKDKERRDELVVLYNSKFNSWVNRKYDGSNLKFKGVSLTAPPLRDYQRNVVSRILFSGNTLMAHCVGSGKTMSMIYAGQKLKELNICKKPMYLIPNHLVESGQFAREYLQLFPRAKILVATAKDFKKENRQRFISKIALGNWDAVIIGHSTFKLIPILNKTKAEFLQKQLNDLEYAIRNIDNKNSITVKKMQCLKKRIEYKLSLLVDYKKDNLLTFEQLGIDQIFVDESQAYKNLYLYTKMSNVAGVPNSFSQKAEDLFIKSQYVINKNGGHRGLVFATGTPVSNTMGELYSLQRYLMLNDLEELDLNYFDAWASIFGEVISSIEINPTGTGYRTKQRFAKFYNIPELMLIFGKVADIISEDMIQIKGKPSLENDKYNIIQLNKTQKTSKYISNLIKRANDIQNKKVSPEEDNMLCVVNDGKKVALDPRLVNIYEDDENSKINSCVNNLFSCWNETKDKRLTQIVFCDLGTPTQKDKFNVYQNIKDKLIYKGVPAKEIAFIHDANTSIKKSKLFKDFREGIIRILIGSTSKCGEGSNFQDRLIALHHLDCPWRPSDLIQREGRILRYGNQNKFVKIFRYATKGTFDSYCWQTVETKAKFIAQLFSGKFPGRSMEDIDKKVLSFAEMKAACSENPLIAERIQNIIEIQKLEALKKGFKKELLMAEHNINELENKIAINTPYLERMEKDLGKVVFMDKFKMEIDGFIFTEHINPNGNLVTGKDDAGNYILNKISKLKIDEIKFLTNYRGFELYIAKYEDSTNVIVQGSCKYYISSDVYGGITIIKRIDNLLDELKNKYNNKVSSNKLDIRQLSDLKNFLLTNKKFKFEDKLSKLKNRQFEIDQLLNIKDNSSDLGLGEADVNVAEAE